MLWKKGRSSDNVVDARDEDVAGGGGWMRYGAAGDFAQGQVSQCDTFATKNL